ncbi:undecaprenyldiphospho-muramoylpentapeptide beta-N-acetylglucosaminyltransferase [Dissulfuribacter thermophilus]|uniref:undecaprenyldiphospho-muramoylpentapeptide beta-N-acetylglucosaminyltransferase n=1 Tax=Dissulfuribacter thermophilus TaxID=1156395 RepID=UPI00137AF948|nr:undecaprenyldiphospho-muramoylpentapeptide beta-N-acetylglucosaminyltransferase [Dissulfuribacter thermophilus]
MKKGVRPLEMQSNGSNPITINPFTGSPGMLFQMRYGDCEGTMSSHRAPDSNADGLGGDRLSNRLNVAVAGGGTGGHIFPGVAILRALEALRPLNILWIGTGKEVERQILESLTIEYTELKVRPFHGAGLGSLIRAITTLPISISRARSILKDFNPNVVLGIGGYVAGPVMIAARSLNIPLVIHEQNVIPGLTNRLGARFAQKIFISFKGSQSWFPGGKSILTGNPVREEFLKLNKHDDGKEYASRPKHILVIGGSQGARAINRLATCALAILAKSGIDLEVIHQTGKQDQEYTRRVYREAGIKASVYGFINDMASAYAWADLVVSRAGAGTCAELSVTGTPSILIPYPHAASSHQEANAKELESCGASITFRENEVGPERLASTIQALLLDTERLSQMRQAARSIAQPYAAKTIAEQILKIVEEA